MRLVIGMIVSVVEIAVTMGLVYCLVSLLLNGTLDSALYDSIVTAYNAGDAGSENEKALILVCVALLGAWWASAVLKYAKE